MLARLQTFIVCFLVITTLVWSAVFWLAGRPIFASAGAVLILLGYALFLGAEFVLLYFVQTHDVASRPTVRQLLAAWWRETLTAPRVFLWHQPFRSNAQPDHVPEQPDGRRAVLLVHGFVCNRGFWNPWMCALRARDIPFMAIDLEPVFGAIDAYTERIDSAVKRLEAKTGLPVVLVGHSMGGLAIRAWFARRGSRTSVHRIITIGSPHQGTWLARYGTTPSGRQMRLASPWLAQLASDETQHQRARFTCFYSHCDNIVFPASSGTLPGADNLHLPGCAHVSLAFEPRVFDEVFRYLR